MINKNFKIFLVLLISIFITNNLFAIVFERRKLLKDDIFEYYIFPAVVERPGVGRVYGVGSVINNIPVPWIEDGKFNFIGGIVKGEGKNYFEGEDINGGALVIIDFPIISNDFTISPARLEGTNISYPLFQRGIDSDPNKTLLILGDKVSQNTAEISYYFFNRQIEVYYTYFGLNVDYSGIITYEGTFIDTSNLENFGSGANFTNQRFGVLLDDTDFRRDPRIGYFIKIDRWEWPKRYPQESSQYQYDFELTGYIPLIDMKLIMVLNQFFSTSKVIESGTVNRNDYICSQEQLFLYEQCQNILDEYYERDLNESKKGRATSLGGIERLRGYPEGRFFDEHTNFRAIELRYYFNPIDIKFDLIFAKGLLAEFQLAGFYDQGTVSPDLGENLWKNFKDTRGIGLRLITGSAVSRIDYGISDEGGETIIYWDYPF